MKFAVSKPPTDQMTTFWIKLQQRQGREQDTKKNSNWCQSCYRYV